MLQDQQKLNTQKADSIPAEVPANAGQVAVTKLQFEFIQILVSCMLAVPQHIMAGRAAFPDLDPGCHYSMLARGTPAYLLGELLTYS